MEEEFTPQPKLSRDEVLAEYAKTGLDQRYSQFFWEKYSAKYDSLSEELPYEEDNSDYALSVAKDGIPWYILYHEIGHPEDWCEKAWNYGAYTPGAIDFVDVADCLWEVFSESYKEAVESREDGAVERVNAELRKNCDYIGKRFDKSPVYMRFFYDWYEDMSGGTDKLDYFKEMEDSYNLAIRKGKKEDFAFYYAQKCISLDSAPDAWRLAELKEKLEKEGKDSFYVGLYLQKYSEGLMEDGEEREHPDIPTRWEEKVIAYMKGWEYTQGDGKSFSPKEMDKFIRIYMEVYLQASHPNNPKAIPWDRFDDFVLDIAERRYRGENAEIEPWDPELFMELMKMNKKPVERKSRNQQIIDDTLDMMFPNGRDDDD